MAEASQRSTLPPQGKESLAREARVDRFESELKITHEQAVRLEEAGYRSPDEVRLSEPERLSKLDFSDEEIKRLREGEPTAAEGGEAPSDALLEKWLQDRKRSGSDRAARGKRPKGLAGKNAPGADLLKRWVAGDDSVMDAWIKEEPAKAAAGGTASAGGPPGPAAPTSPSNTPAPSPGSSETLAPSPPSPPPTPPATESAGPTPSVTSVAPVPSGPTAPGAPGAVGPAGPAAPSAPAAPPAGEVPAPKEGGKARPPPLRAKAAAAAGAAPAVAGAEISDLRAREETVLKWLTELLDKAKAENFDPGQLLREAQDLTRQLHEERGRRRELEEELEHVKKGSVAVIKYVRNREARAREEAIAAKEADILELRRQLESARASGSSLDTQKVLAERDEKIRSLEEDLDKAKTVAGTSTGAQHELTARFQEEMEKKDRDFAEKEAELKRKVIKAEEEVQKVRSAQELAERHAQLAKMDEKNLTSELKSKLATVEARERSIVTKETEFKTKIEELMVKADEFEKKRAPMAYKEQELIRWEEELRVKEGTVKAQMREVEQAKKEGTNVEERDKLRRLEDLKAEIQKKEDEMRQKEAYLNQKLEELERKERDVTEEEIERAREDLKAEVAQNKVKTGVNRLDDLLLGGVPLGTSVLVNAPSHTGKDVMARLMAAEGLKKGVPILWILSDKATSTLREEMTAVLPSYLEYEKKGLVRYVDLYSMSLGITTADPLVTMLSTEDKNFLESLSKAVDEVAADFRKKAEYYRLIFETVSTVTAYLDDAQSSFRFLQPFVGRRKRDKAVAYYLVDTGMHSENDIQVLEHMMDGSVNLKVDQLKTYLAVKGLGDVASRAWIAYTFTKKVFNIGSFSLDHIR
ncbi:MAG: hypothetical protein KGJ23_03120 [Euryarchaeota archaeon]|nr:hypothetical protein [Euryarchaeota archaeon]MDE1835589.1 hypothetical protein [Euryarchaeota archaeon]MDE1878937.1 hypothetical protein [Euryarchaeota archaeon]MDE2043789.1 hypothetical protein [Thermoplasmata archaeon]